MDDQELVQRAAEGDAVAFELLVRRHADRLWRLARSILRDDELAEEAVQDTFLRAHRGLSGFRGESSPHTWLATICRHRCLDQLRLRRADVVPLDAARHPSPTRDHDLRLTLEAGLRTLPDDERDAFVLVHVLGYRREEAAEVVGVPASTLRSRVHRAQQRLAEAVAAEPLADGGLHA